MVSVDVEEILNNILREIVPTDVVLSNDGTLVRETATGSGVKQVLYVANEDRINQIIDVITGIKAIKQFYGMEKENEN